MQKSGLPFQDTLRTLETVPNMYLIVSPDLFILTASNLFLEATKTSRESIVGRHIFDAFPDNPELPDADGVRNINASLQEVLKTKKAHFMEIQRYDVPDISKPGAFITRYWEPSHTPVLDENGNVQYIIQHANNITEKVLRLAELAESRKIGLNALKKIELLNLELDVLRISELEHEKNERHFRYLADLVPAKISNALPSGEVTYFNKHWLDYSGMSFEDLRDFGYFQMMHPDEIEPFQAGLKHSAETGVPYESEMRFKDINGDYRWHLNIASPVFDDDGKIIMWAGSTTDIQRLKDEEQRKSDFIGMVSHELKTPLTSIKAYLQVMEVKAKNIDDENVQKIIDRSLMQIKKMTSMIDGFMSVSRLESSKIIIAPTGFDLGKLIGEIRDDFKNTVTSHQLVFVNVEDIPELNADRDRIEQVIKNFIANAVKYSPRGTDVIFNCKTEGKEIHFSVSDSGTGIDPIHHQKIFQRYFRIENDLSKTTSGFGIGLYFCSEIIALHKGRIWVESEIGKGSTFHFTLPRE